jgi:DNA invertase Pin-like site-specific DNA recombinase
MEIGRIAPLVQAAEGMDPIAGLSATAEVRRELERLEAVLVRRARIQGRTWTEIATVLGVSKQAVHKKYGGRGLFRNQD